VSTHADPGAGSARHGSTRDAVREPIAPVPEQAASHAVAVSDGVCLATDVYLPAGKAPFPAILVRLPYDKAGPLAYMPYVAEYFSDRGFAVVLQDVRGKIRSEGEAMAFVHEARDGYDTIDWIVGQSWCNGVVGMYGDSYYGFTQWAAAASRHPALRAIVPRLTGSEVGSVWMYPGNVFRLATMAWWGAYAWVDRYLYDVACDWSVRPFADLVPAWLDGARSASLDDWAGLEQRSRFWMDIYAGRPPTSDLVIPALNVGGWWDVFHRGAVRDWTMARRSGRAPQHLLLDAIDHYDDQLLKDGEPQPDMYASRDAMLAFLPRPLEPATRFFVRYLKDEATLRIPFVRWKLVNAGWREASDWPPPEAVPLTLHLGEAKRAGDGPQGGTLRRRPDSTRGSISWRHDPQDLVPSLEEDEWRPLLGLPDEVAAEVRDDVLTFTGDPLARPLDIAGPVRVSVTVTSDAPALDVIAKMVDVYPSGRARRMAEGARRVVSRGRDEVATVDLGHVGYRLECGHCLRLEIASSAFPRYLPYPGLDVDVWTSVKTAVNQQTLSAGGGSSAFLRLMVLPDSDTLARASGR
jgi:uncharacterized protein